MTKTSTAKVQRTATPTTTPDGRQGFLIRCTCASHVGYGDSAIVAYPIAVKNIHGTVLMANHPAKIMRVANERKGVWAA